jgi:hypothetical protein
MNWSDLIGKKIVAFRGLPYQKSQYDKKKVTPLSYILFDDKETILELSEQDYYDYHDCSQSARNLTLHKDAKLWKRMFDKEVFAEPDNVGHSLFD